MANIKSAKKRARQTIVRRLRNAGRRTEIKSTIKKAVRAIDVDKDREKADQLLRSVSALLSRAKSKSLLHRNTAARRMSRLRKRFDKVFAVAS